MFHDGWFLRCCFYPGLAQALQAYILSLPAHGACLLLRAWDQE
jgi:hypothetical protein